MSSEIEVGKIVNPSKDDIKGTVVKVKSTLKKRAKTRLKEIG